MREIKFRVWDPVQHKMLKPSYLEFIDGNAYWVEAGEDDSQNDGPIDSPVTRPVVKVGMLLEQYTGVNDTNGREIYEGDIIRFQLFATAQGIVGDIRYNSRYGYCVFFYNGVKTMWRQEYWTDYKALQVVGNIHEDPELLEGDNDD